MLPYLTPTAALPGAGRRLDPFLSVARAPAAQLTNLRGVGASVQGFRALVVLGFRVSSTWCLWLQLPVLISRGG